MLILRSDIEGTRVVEIDRLIARGARGPSGRDVRFLLDASAAEFVLHSTAFDRGRLARSFVGNGILFSDGDHWKERRRLIQPTFPPREPDYHRQDVTWAVPGLVNRFETAARTKTSVGVVEESVRYTTRVLYRGVFGQELPEDHDRVRVILDYFDSIGGVLSATIFPSLKLDGSTMRQVRDATSAMQVEVDRLVDVRRRVDSESTSEPEAVRIDALGKIVDRLGSEGDENAIRDEVRSLLVAGAETTSNTLGFLLLMLATNPDLCDRLHRGLEEDRDEECPLLDAVILETLRLFPPVWFQTREAREPIDVSGTRVEQDDLVFVSTAVIHRDPEMWPEPDAFRPDRFLPGPDGPWRPPHRYAFFPFGGGRHLCIGRHLAMHELRLSVRALVGRFRFEVDPAAEIAAELGVVLKPAREVRLRVIEREERAQ